MTSAETAAQPFSAIARSAAQTRILVAALDLFAEHGVSGTSLQMIADALGVTKAAVYHQFKTKDEIALIGDDTGPEGSASQNASAKGSGQQCIPPLT